MPEKKNTYEEVYQGFRWEVPRQYNCRRERLTSLGKRYKSESREETQKALKKN